MLGQCIGAAGEILSNEINQRIIGLRLQELAAVPRVIAVASGLDKCHAVRAALATELVHDLVIDFDTASTVLGLAQR